MNRINVSGFVQVRKNGELICSGRNMIVTAGLAMLAGALAGSASAPSHMAIGDNGTVPSEADTDLAGTELERVSVTPTAVAATLQLESTFGSGVGSPSTVREVGIFNHASTGSMLARFLPVPFDIQSTDTVTITWQITFSTGDEA